jgi:hypothetical protein
MDMAEGYVHVRNPTPEFMDAVPVTRRTAAKYSNLAAQH